MSVKENNTEGLTLYSQRAIMGSTFFGGPLAAGYLIRQNYLSLGKPELGKKALLISIVSTILLYTGLFILPESVSDKIPNSLFPLAYAGIIYLIVEKIHGKILKEHKEKDYEFYSGWKAAGVGLVSLIITLICVFGFVFLSPESAEFEQYNTQIDLFSKNENETITFYDRVDTESPTILINELENRTIPKWEENIQIIKNSSEIENLPSEFVEQNKKLLVYSELRLKAFKLIKKSLIEDTDEYFQELDNRVTPLGRIASN